MDRNIRLTLSWSGEQFYGYQFQPHLPTVQGALLRAWKMLCQEDVNLVGSSRLDAKVHAQHYILNFYTKSLWKCEKIVRALNGILHSQGDLNLFVLEAQEVSADFHARFHAVGKHYRYLLWHGFGQHVLTSRAWHVKSSQPLEKLCFILKEFEGTHDFAGFRAADCTAKTTVRRVFKIDSWCHPQYSQLMIVDIWGEGFLKNMIRNMVGTAVEMAIGKRKKDTITEAFQHKNRQLVGTCAPGKALTLMEVFYNMEKLQHNIARGARHLILC